MELLKGREDQLDEGIVDTLAAFDNFLEFKNQALEMKLRQLKRDEPAQYALIVEKNKGSKNIMNIVNMIESQGDLMQVDFISNNDMY
jgi:hypothetical protein